MSLDPSFKPRTKKKKKQQTPPLDNNLGGTFTPGGFVPNKPTVVLPTDQAPYKHGRSPAQTQTKSLASTGEVRVVDRGPTHSDAQRAAQTMQMQRMLNGYGAHLAVDGQWGPQTEAAYQAYLHHRRVDAEASRHIDASQNAVSAPLTKQITPRSVHEQVLHDAELKRRGLFPGQGYTSHVPFFEGQKPDHYEFNFQQPPLLDAGGQPTFGNDFQTTPNSVPVYKNPSKKPPKSWFEKHVIDTATGMVTGPVDIAKAAVGSVVNPIADAVQGVEPQWMKNDGGDNSQQPPDLRRGAGVPFGQDSGAGADYQPGPSIIDVGTAVGKGFAHPVTDLAAIVSGRKHGSVTGVLSDLGQIALYVSPAKIAQGAKIALRLKGIEASAATLEAAARATDPIESASRTQVIGAISQAPHVTQVQQSNLLHIMDTVARVRAQQEGVDVATAWDELFAGAQYVGRAPKPEELLANAYAQISDGASPPWHEIQQEKVAKNLKAKLKPNARRVEASAPTHDLVSPVHGQRVLGQPSFEEWINRVIHSTPDVRQQILDATWYERLKPAFEQIFGPGYEPVLRAFGASQANAGPSGGMVSVLRAIERLERGAKVKQDYGSIGSVVADQIEQAYKGVTLTRGQAAKLSDFLDAIRGMKTRSWMGHDPLAGMPAPSDIWSARDAGFLDKKLASKAHHHNFIVEKHGVDLRALPPDMVGAPSGYKYERISEMYNAFADELNKVAYHGRTDWTPAQAQAMGWAAMQRFYGRPLTDISEWIQSGRAGASKAIQRDQGIEAQRALEGQHGVHVIDRKTAMGMEPNADYLYHGTNDAGMQGILGSGRIEARATERNPEDLRAWLTDHPARAGAQGKNVIAIPRENLIKSGLQAHPLGMHSSPTDVHIYGDPLDTTTAQIHSEAVPQPDLHPALNKRYLDLPPELQAQYARAADGVALGSHFEEIVGLDRVGHHFGIGVWRGDENPGLGAHVHVENLTSEEVTKLNAVASAYGMAKNQGSVSWGRPLPLTAKGDNVFPAVLAHTRARGDVGALVDSTFGNGLVGVIHGPGDTTYLVDFTGEIPNFEKTAQQVLGSTEVHPIKWQGGYTIDERLKTEDWETTFQDAVNAAPNSDALKNAIEHANSVIAKIGDRVFPQPGLKARQVYDGMLSGILEARGLKEDRPYLTKADRAAAEEILHTWAKDNADNPLAQQFESLSEAAHAADNALDPEHYFRDSNALFGSMERAQGITQMLRQEGETVKGMVTRSEDMQHFLTLFEGADASTVLHELAHAVEKYLPDMGLSPEELARSVEQYFRLGVAPNEALAGPMRELAKNLAEIYHHESVPGHKFNPEVGAALDRLLGGEKKYRIEDVQDGAAKTYWHTGGETTIGKTETLMGTQGAPAFHMHALDENGNVVAAQHGYLNPADNSLYASSVYVHPEHRGQGLSSMMHARVMDFAQKNGIEASAVFKNQELGQRTMEQARARGRNVRQEGAVTYFQKDGPELTPEELAKIDPENLGHTYEPVSNLTPEQQLKEGLKGARSVYGKEKAGRHEQAAERYKNAEAAMLANKDNPDLAVQAFKQEMRGPYQQIDFQGLKTLDAHALRQLKQYAMEHPGLHGFQRVRLVEALDRAVLDGKVPRPNELRLIEHVFGPVNARAINNVAEQGGWDKFFNLMNVPRSLMATADLSAGLRQGLVAATTHPILWGKSWPAMVRSMLKGEHYERDMQAIKNDPWYNHALAGGVSFTDVGAESSLAAHEEAFASDYAARIPGIGHVVKGSARGYTVFLNKLRMDMFAQQMRIAAAAGRDLNNEQFLTKMADVVNAATGRGTIHGRAEHILPALNSLLFSPRLMLSRLNYLDPTWYYRLGHDLPPGAARQVRLEALKGLFATAGAVSATVYLASLIPGVHVETDPRSSDFGKIKVGDTRLDVAGGFQQYIRLAAELATNTKISTTTGQKTKLGSGFGVPTRWDEVQNFVYNKFAPVPGMARDIIKGKDPVGNSLGAYDWKEFAQHFTPLVGQDALDLYNDRKGGVNGIAAALGGYGLGAVGVGVQTYKAKNPADKKVKTLQDEAKKAGVTVPKDVLTAEDHKAHLDQISHETQGDPQKRLALVIKYYAQTTGDHSWDHLIGQDGITDQQAEQGIANFRHALIGEGLGGYEKRLKAAAEKK